MNTRGELQLSEAVYERKGIPEGEIGIGQEDRRRERQLERIRQVQKMKRRIAAGVLGAIFCIAAGILISGLQSRNVIDTVESGNTDSKEAVDEGQAGTVAESLSDRERYLSLIEELAASDERYQSVLDNQEEYPDSILRLCAQNSEALNFVLDYPEKKDLPAETTIGDVTKGQIPLLIQWDRRWGYAPYGEGRTVAVSGCGPTCIAMVASGITGRTDITPAVVAKYSEESGFLTESMDTSWDLMTYGCEEYGITGTELGMDENAMIQELFMGHPIIASVGPGDFTLAGHFIVIAGYDNGSFQVNDPNSLLKSQQTWTFEQLKGQIVNMWYYTEI